MGKTKKELEERRMRIKKLYESGLNVYQIADTVGVALSTVYNSLSIMGITLQKAAGKDESNLVYADNSVPVLEKVVIHGNWLYKNRKKYRVNRICTDITPLFAPR